MHHLKHLDQPKTDIRIDSAYLFFAALIYGLFVVYGSLVPLNFHFLPMEEAWSLFRNIPYLKLGIGSRADWVANILLYIPLAFFTTGFFKRVTRSATLLAALIAIIFCTLLALTVEFTQLFFPPRTVSLNDIVAEIMGSAIGTGIWFFSGERLVWLWQQFKGGGRQGTHALIALYTLAYLGFSLFPYDFLVSGAELEEKLIYSGHAAFFVAPTCGAWFQCSTKLFAELLTVAPLGAFLGMMAIAGRKPRFGMAFGWGILLGIGIEGMQVFLASGVSQGASIITRGLGMVAGLVFYHLFQREWLVQYRTQIKFGIALLLPVYLGFLLALNGLFSTRIASVAAALEKLDEVHWLPFYYHYFTSETQAMHSLLTHAGAYAPIGVAVWLFRINRPKQPSLWLPATLAAFTAFLMEAMKLFLDGKKPDPTDVLIAAAAAAFASFAVSRIVYRAVSASSGPTQSETPPPSRNVRRHGLKVGMGLLIGVMALGGWVIVSQPKEKFVFEEGLLKLPKGEELPPVNLPGFREAHPRLPSPSGTEVAMLVMNNRGFVDAQRRLAGGGQGEVRAVALMELIEPGSQDLNILFEHLMKLEPTYRGHDQGRPLALAYDWLYHRWSESQRVALREKLVDVSEYLINVIRQERLSPYNVYLYNAPFQALMACSLALYRDDPRGEPVMRFTYDLWKNRVLPAWRQVMGNTGGWHEGGEYVGIGIGQAVYQVPAMWRNATGEDLFATEPGIRGFLDFLVYRTRPDGTQFRWGDGAFFDKIIPDAAALALEYRHAAAYSLRPPGKESPTSWPWGPLIDASLVDPLAASRLPLTRLFDGIGMVVARSDWSPEATYVTFKAGDNFWSHTHLDQGAFTIYKGGELAIDSGLYGPKYGSDHHMNYQYQTIAHNTITVTDPDDTVPAPGKKKPRSIANDGGQRRVGSGWGVEAAPLDRAEWDAKRDIYHTGKIEQLLDQDGLAVAVADVTPAYTNQSSGNGSFSHRSRRVERFWRTFAYDRIDDAVVVFDQVAATKAVFRKRWLLHTIEQPRRTPDGFATKVSPQDRTGHGGGQLQGHVLLPKQANIQVIGGRGLEFFVDSKNYDEEGKLKESLKKLGPNNGEPGEWRIEVTPERDAVEDNFLVVLLPTRLGEKPAHHVRLIEAGHKVGCEISGPMRTTRWWFEPGRNGVEIEVIANGNHRGYRIVGQSTASVAPYQRNWLETVKVQMGLLH
jgi:VanZ family protein